jgi:hypothetical protein
MAYFVDLFLFLGRPIQFAEAEKINKWKSDEGMNINMERLFKFICFF